jgi:hypothetical protein
MLVVIGPWSTETAELLSTERIDGLVVNYARGFNETDLTVLTDGRGTRRLRILDLRITDLSPIGVGGLTDGGIVVYAPETNQAMLWIRGPMGDPRPALIQTSVPLDDREFHVPFEQGRAVAEWLQDQRGRWRGRPTEVDDL